MASSLSVLLTFHVPTLVMVTVFVCTILGTLLLFTWLQDRSVRALAWWGVTCLLTAGGVAALGLRGAIPDFLSIAVANALLFLAAGMNWGGARVFAGRLVPLRWVIVPPLLWIAAVQVPPLSGNITARIVVFSLVLAAFVFATAYTFWRGRDEPLMSRWAVIVVLAVHGGLHVFRIPASLLFPLPPENELFQSGYFGGMMSGLLLFMVAFAFTLLALTKERAELHHKQAARIDPLTGLLNRRALFQAGEEMARAATEEGTVSVLLFDLDRFKQINDRFGHPVGDRVLQLFAAAARAELRSCDILGRLGGEEFAAFLPQRGVEQAMQAGERVRQRFAAAARQVGLSEFQPTVSVGVAVSGVAASDSAALIVEADRAVYRAKAAGRDCVRAAQPPHAKPRVAAAPALAVRLDTDTDTDAAPAVAEPAPARVTQPVAA